LNPTKETYEKVIESLHMWKDRAIKAEAMLKKCSVCGELHCRTSTEYCAKCAKTKRKQGQADYARRKYNKEMFLKYGAKKRIDNATKHNTIVQH